MKMNKIITITTGCLVLVVSTMGLLSSCMEKEPSLVPLPVPSFTSVAIAPTSDSPSNMEFINTTPKTIAYWFINRVRYQGDTIKATFKYAGDFPVQLIVAGQGGMDSCTQVVNVPDNNPYAINPTSIQGILTGARLGLNQRTWTAERVVNSVIRWNTYNACIYQITGDRTGAPFAFGPADIATDGTGRDGYFDDKYTFTLGLGAAPFIYDDNNTVYLDGGGSLWTAALPGAWSSFSGTTSSTDLYNLIQTLKPWGSGNFTYTILDPPAGPDGINLGQIIVNGIGAHIGLQDKSSDNGVLTTPSATSVTYDILRMLTDITDESTGETYDEIILGVTPQTLQAWAFILKSPNH